MVEPGRAGSAVGEGDAEVAGNDGDLVIFCASLGGAGRNGGTPRPVSDDDSETTKAGLIGFEPDGSPFSLSGTTVTATGGGGVTTLTGVGSSGLRRLNKTLYQTARGNSAYHGRNCETILRLSFRNLHNYTNRSGNPSFGLSAVSSMCTMQAAPTMGIKRFKTGIYAASAKMAPWPRISPRNWR